MGMKGELDRILRRWLRWYRWRRSLKWGMRGLCIGMLAALIVGVSLIWQRMLLLEEYTQIAVLFALDVLVIGALAGYFWPADRMRLARWFDLQFGLQERVSTALELRSRVSGDPLWRKKQAADTLAAARKVNLTRKLPIKFERWTALVACGLMIALALVGYRAKEFFQEALNGRQVQHIIDMEKDKVGSMIEQIEQTQALTPAEREVLTEPLKEAMRALEEARTKEQALSAVNEAEQQLRSQAEQNGEQVQALQQAGEKLSESNSSSLQETGKALANQDLKGAMQQLQNTDPSAMSPTEQQQMAQDLQQAANDLQDSNPELAQSLQQAAQALHQGDSQAAKQALQQAGQQVGEAQLRVISADVAKQAADQLKQSQQTAMQGSPSSTPGPNGQGGQNGQAGQNGQNGQGNNPNGTGQTGAGGAGRGDQQGALGPSGEAPNQEIEQNNGAGDGGIKDYEKIYSPEHLGGDHDLGLSAPPSGQPGEQIIGQQPSGLGNDNPGQVPYIDVLPSYSEAYRKAMQSGEVPAYLRPVIRQYFSSLEP